MSFNSPIAVITDMDGLLLDSEKEALRAWTLACNKQGFELSLEIALSGVGCGSFRQMLKEHFGSEFDVDAAANLRVDLERQEVSKRGMPLRPGAMEFINKVKSLQIPFGLAKFTIKSDALWRLERAGISVDNFQAMTFGDEVENLKPDPEIYLVTAAKLGVRPEDVLAFEDSSSGVKAALAAGMRVVCIPDLEKHTPTPCEQLLMHDSLLDYLAVPR